MPPHQPGVARTAGVVLCVSLLSLTCAREPCQKLSTVRPTRDDLARIAEEPQPRCAAADPTCGPAPVEKGHPCYRPTAARELLPPTASDDDVRGSSHECAHDGECLIAGCGNACVDYRHADINTNCIGYEWLDESAFCGCVSGGCSFFRQ